MTGRILQTLAVVIALPFLLAWGIAMFVLSVIATTCVSLGKIWRNA